MNPKLTFRGARLHPGQMKIFEDIQSSNAMYYTICTPRQWGKSFFALQLMLFYAINFPDSKVMFATLSHRQGSKIFNELMNGIKDSGIVIKKNGLENSITLINGSEIYFVSVQQPEILS